jgi:hypothetical protein
MNFVRLFLVAVICINLVGCATTELQGPTMKEICESRVGKHYSEFVKQWGSYNHESVDGKGGRILVWLNTPILLGQSNQGCTTLGVDADGYVYKCESNQKSPAEIEFIKAERRNAVAAFIAITAVAGIAIILYNMSHMDFSAGNGSLGDDWW